jgi:ATP-binding cassette subfamily B protein
MTGVLTELSALRAAGGTVERIDWLRRVSEAQSAGRKRQAAMVPSRLAHGITLNEVSFTYPENSKLVLDRVSLEMPAGQTTALVVENGVGKFTLVKLLPATGAGTSLTAV